MASLMGHVYSLMMKLLFLSFEEYLLVIAQLLVKFNVKLTYTDICVRAINIIFESRVKSEVIIGQVLK